MASPIVFQSPKFPNVVVTEKNSKFTVVETLKNGKTKETVVADAHAAVELLRSMLGKDFAASLKGTRLAALDAASGKASKGPSPKGKAPAPVNYEKYLKEGAAAVGLKASDKNAVRAEVKRLQRVLRDAGFPCGAAGVDGWFGPETKSDLARAITHFHLEKVAPKDLASKLIAAIMSQGSVVSTKPTKADEGADALQNLHDFIWQKAKPLADKLDAAQTIPDRAAVWNRNEAANQRLLEQLDSLMTNARKTNPKLGKNPDIAYGEQLLIKFQN